jgi:hypothetical protein
VAHADEFAVVNPFNGIDIRPIHANSEPRIIGVRGYICILSDDSVGAWARASVPHETGTNT